MKEVFHQIKIEIKCIYKRVAAQEIVQPTLIVSKRETLIISTIYLIYLVNLNND